MKKILLRIGVFFMPLALAIGTASVNSPSYVIYHQPEIPSSMLKLKKK